MVHGVVIKTKGIQSRICRPFIRVDDGPRHTFSLDNWQQCISVTSDHMEVLDISVLLSPKKPRGHGCQFVVVVDVHHIARKNNHVADTLSCTSSNSLHATMATEQCSDPEMSTYHDSVTGLSLKDVTFGWVTVLSVLALAYLHQTPIWCLLWCVFLLDAFAIIYRSLFDEVAIHCLAGYA